MSDPRFGIEEVSDPTEIARSHAQHEQFLRNLNWLEAHWADLLPRALGKHLAVAGQTAYLADTSEEAWAMAQAAHPEDAGAFCQYVRPQRGPRIYAHRRQVAAL